jgi:hypothetical protein
MTSDYPNRRRALAIARARKSLEQPQRPWNMRERWRTARIVVRLMLAYSPRNLGSALIVAGTLIKCIDETWEKYND